MRTLATRFHFIRCWNARRKAPRGTLLISYHTIPYSKSYFPSMELYIYIHTFRGTHISHGSLENHRLKVPGLGWPLGRFPSLSGH